jgi:hypothetical protein
MSQRFFLGPYSELSRCNVRLPEGVKLTKGTSQAEVTMKRITAVAGVIVSAMILPSRADTLSSKTSAPAITNASTIAAVTAISPGRYSSSVLPSFNSEMGGQLKKAIGAVHGVKDVEANAEDSSIHFTIQEGVTVRQADLQKALVKADSGAVLSSPVLEHSMTPNPGL